MEPNGGNEIDVEMQRLKGAISANVLLTTDVSSAFCSGLMEPSVRSHHTKPLPAPLFQGPQTRLSRPPNKSPARRPSGAFVRLSGELVSSECVRRTHRWSSPVLPSPAHTGRYQATRSVRGHTLQCRALRRKRRTER